MWAAVSRWAALALCVLATAALAAGCGGGGGGGAATTGAAASTPTPTTPAPGVPHAAQSSVNSRMAVIVHEWADRLDADDYAGIAKLFALPAVMIQGQNEYRLTTRKQIAVWHSGLPCAGKIVKITFEGRIATAVFRLVNRGKTKCDAPGTLAAAAFEIAHGKIVAWVQVPVPGAKKTTTAPVA